MTEKTPGIGPGEAKTRRRNIKQIAYYGVAALMGGAIGAVLAAGESGEGSFFSRDFANLSLDPTLALIMAGVMLVAFLVLPVWGFTQIDELLKEQNLIGMSGGCIAVMSGYPAWLMLFAGGFVEAPHPFGVYMLLFGGMIASFLFAKFRN